jgi:hypothetical protein
MIGMTNDIGISAAEPATQHLQSCLVNLLNVDLIVQSLHVDLEDLIKNPCKMTDAMAGRKEETLCNACGPASSHLKAQLLWKCVSA